MKAARRCSSASCAFQLATGSSTLMREVAKIASHNCSIAFDGVASGNMAAAQAGVALATIVQLISWRVISSSAGR